MSISYSKHIDQEEHIRRYSFLSREMMKEYQSI